ncbi:MAG: N-6 DNA methylase [Alphaproteobacteria bacterium]|nr:N-6 DNA methylase [Alphaproteobacteria bacterium]
MFQKFVSKIFADVYDPCCGSGGMFVQSVKFLLCHNYS